MDIVENHQVGGLETEKKPALPGCTPLNYEKRRGQGAKLENDKACEKKGGARTSELRLAHQHRGSRN